MYTVFYILCYLLIFIVIIIFFFLWFEELDIMSGTDGEDDYKALQSFDGEGDDDLGLFGDLSSFDGLALEEDAADSGTVCPQCL